MSRAAHRGARRYPPGIPYIIGNEAAERFSYYGMKTILVVFMTGYLVNSAGAAVPMSEGEATVWYHTFSMANYFVPLFGALLSDIWWGKYRTIMALSSVYCLGHLCLALDGTRMGLAAGLALIAMGSGGIKPCVSAHVGDQFTDKHGDLLARMFGYFYLAVNVGAFISSLLTPVLLERYGPRVAFAVPGVLMLLATIVFRIGRERFVTIAPIGWSAYRRAIFSPHGRRAMRDLAVVYLFVALFWSLFDQSGSTWVIQSEHMDRQVALLGMSFEILPSQLQALNPILILAFVPCLAWLYPRINRRIKVTAVGKIASGLALTGAAFVLIAHAQELLDQGQRVSVLWQVGAYVLITLAEALVSVTALEFAYTQAPHAMKSFLMSFYLLAVSLGNAITAVMSYVLMDGAGASRVSQHAYFWCFTALVWIGAAGFYLLCRGYEEKHILHGEIEAASEMR